MDDEKLKQYIRERPIPNKLITALQLAPTVSETDSIFDLTGAYLPSVLRRRRNQELTEREKQVLWLISHGYSRKMCGEALHISKHTVDHHVKLACVVLQAHGIDHAVGLALRAGIID